MSRASAAPLAFWASLIGGAACQEVDIYAVTDTSESTVSGPTDATEPIEEPAGDFLVDGGTNEPSASSESCSMAVLPVGDTSVTLQVGAVTRSYVLHVPAGYDGTEPVPLVVDFHGIGGSGWDQLASSPYPEVTDPQAAIMAFPDGLMGPLGSAWNMGPCCVEDVDDFAFARTLVQHVRQTACIDADRVYAVGVLTGGGMAHHLACQAADVFAAVSPAAFDLLQETVDDCIPSRPITVITFRGTADDRVPYAGGPSSLVPGMPITFLGAEGSFEKWAEIDGCTGSPSAEDSNGCAAYLGCAGGVEVILCTEIGGSGEPGAADVAWPVLERHVR